MILKRLKLTNIRSYTDAVVDFPKGSVLLAGDIGSGKSTILLAIEFALFGIKASELPGSALLRHGKREGSVELEFCVEGKEILIKRALKSGANGIVQDAGYIMIDGIKKDATPKELRAIVFEILGYPKDLVSKSKDLVYRYTVYTPQEAMKEILYAKPEERLDILRRVFNVDKYKRIRENTIFVLSSLKEKRKELEGFTLDLHPKKQQQAQLNSEIVALQSKIKEIEPSHDVSKQALSKKAKEAEGLEKEMGELNLLLREFAGLESRMHSLLDHRKRNQGEIERIDREIAALQKEVEGKAVVDIEDQLSKAKSRQSVIEIELKKVYKEMHSLSSRMEQSEETLQKVGRLDDCPMCRQHVTHEHKDSISKEEKGRQKEWSQALLKFKEDDARLSLELANAQKEGEMLRKQQNEMAIVSVKLVNLRKREAEKIAKAREQESLKKELGTLNMKKLDISLSIEQKKGAQERFDLAKKALDIAREEERKLDIAHASLQKELEGVLRMGAHLEKDIKDREEAMHKLSRLKEVQEWLSQFFMNLMGTIERHVMLAINREFNEYFKNWFSTLMEDETLSVRLDDDFTPQIEQNGYETSIENLSGGEKTSVALAYRLSLNKVINDIVSQIKTKGILMLDEPTDGFSTEQLDKVREVLEMLRVDQIIMVSHEAKIESFVDKVIRVSKQDHVSRVIA